MIHLQKKTITGIESCDFARVKNLQKMSPRKKKIVVNIYIEEESSEDLE